MLSLPTTAEKASSWGADQAKLFKDTPWVELGDIKFISTCFWISTDLSVQPTDLVDIIEPHQIIGVGMFVNPAVQI